MNGLWEFLGAAKAASDRFDALLADSLWAMAAWCLLCLVLSISLCWWRLSAARRRRKELKALRRERWRLRRAYVLALLHIQGAAIDARRAMLKTLDEL
jgi:hypothetical protein